MQDQTQDTATASGLSLGGTADPHYQPVMRSRWSPKPEQILILESIFNSGMVNPPKDEAVKIRKLLEKFGSVGDANVFYWFQNRRSRSRRRQRQIQQASLSSAGGEQMQAPPRGGGGGIQYENMTPSGGFTAVQSLPPNYHMNTESCNFLGSSSTSSSSYGYGEINDGNNSDDHHHIFGFSGHPSHGPYQEFEQRQNFSSGTDASSFHHQSGYFSEAITVLINGVATEVGKGPVDMRALFDVDNFVLVNENGFLVQSFQHGESYFLVPRQS